MIKKILFQILFKLYKQYFFYTEVNNLTLQEIIQNEFHKLYYYNDHRTWRNTYWLGVPTLKVPLDLWIYQEIIVNIKPDVIIECGTAFGGSALFFATICEAINNGEIISIDIDQKKNRPLHKRIEYLEGSSTSKKIISSVKKRINKVEKVMVILDSSHKKEHVVEELNIYSKFVTKNSYLIVEDTHLHGNPVRPDFNDGGPMEALIDFLNLNSNFTIDITKEKFYFTFYPKGFLKRIA